MTRANTLLEQFRQNRDERPEEPAFLIAAGDRSVPISWREFAEDIEEIAWIVRADAQDELNSVMLVAFFDEAGKVCGAWYRASTV
jgi:hypothetical protein